MPVTCMSSSACSRFNPHLATCRMCRYRAKKKIGGFSLHFTFTSHLFLISLLCPARYLVAKKKMATSAETLCRYKPDAFKTFTEAVMNLKFEVRRTV